MITRENFLEVLGRAVSIYESIESVQQRPDSIFVPPDPDSPYLTGLLIDNYNQRAIEGVLDKGMIHPIEGFKYQRALSGISMDENISLPRSVRTAFREFTQLQSQRAESLPNLKKIPEWVSKRAKSLKMGN